jgi:signal peptidase I
LYQPMGGPQKYLIHTEPAIAKEIEGLPYIKRISLWKNRPGEYEQAVMPQSRYLVWNKDNFGPLYIPKKGAVIKITPRNLALYGKYIVHYEDQKDVKIQGEKLFIGRREVKEYAFQQNYYFMMGDNRHNSEDSRYWGFVPESHVLGKPVLVWMSSDPDRSIFNPLEKIRWKRLFTLIE